MNNQIEQYQLRLYNKLFFTLPTMRKIKEFNLNSNIDFDIDHFFYLKQKDFWFTKDEKEDKYYFLFGLYDKPISYISGNDVCLIIDFDKNIQFNNNCLGLFGIKNFEIHILINYKILKERYPYINTSNFKINNFKSFDESEDMEIIDLGGLENDFIGNIEKLIKESAIVKPQIPKVVKKDSFGNKIIIAQMNTILEDLENGKSEDEAIAHANVSKSTYNYWINRGKQDFGEIYVQFYQEIYKIKSRQYGSDDSEEINDKNMEEIRIIADEGIYEPLIAEYEDLFNSMNQTGIAWVNKTGNKWNYSRDINGRTINLSANTITELYEEVINNDLIWGIRDYDKAKEFIDIPDDFEIPFIPQVEERDDNSIDVDPDIYAPLPEEYENSFNSMNQTGIAWVNQNGKKWVYTKKDNGKIIQLKDETIYGLYEKVKNANQIWGIRDYDKAKEFIDIPDDFEIPKKQKNESPSNNQFDESIYAPLSPVHLSKFNPNPNNKSGIAWVNKVGNNWVYQRQKNGKLVKIHDSNIIDLHKKVISNNQIWGIFDINKARKAIETNSIDDKE